MKINQPKAEEAFSNAENCIPYHSSDWIRTSDHLQVGALPLSYRFMSEYAVFNARVMLSPKGSLLASLLRTPSIFMAERSSLLRARRPHGSFYEAILLLQPLSKDKWEPIARLVLHVLVGITRYWTELPSNLCYFSVTLPYAPNNVKRVLRPIHSSSHSANRF